MWQQGPWDVIVVGGGITGAGVLHEASRRGLRALLVEQRDFAWGTSSRSGKMVHGGLRYLRQGQVRTTWQSVRERERLVREFPGLVAPLGFVMPLYRGSLERAMMGTGLAIYDLIAATWRHRYVGAREFGQVAPHVREPRGGYAYRDALTDDARLVLRLIHDSGGAALSYTRVVGLLRTAARRVEGVLVRDEVTGATTEVRAGVVINATGAWADGLRPGEPRLRLLRGSHLIFPHARLPVDRGIIFLHPVDRRPLYVLPWEGATVAGTTDVDHDRPMEEEPRITPGEADYLLVALRWLFPQLDLSEQDVLSTFSGVRAVIATGRRDPSKEPRDHAVWREDLLTVTGGKLTTFRIMANDALRAAGLRGARGVAASAASAAERAEALRGLDEETRTRLLARYGADAPMVAEGGTERVAGTTVPWGEVRYAAAHEDVTHLDDLLLRRVRLGLLLPEGGIPLLPQIRQAMQDLLGWDDARWQAEAQRYEAIWRAAYSPHLARG